MSASRAWGPTTWGQCLEICKTVSPARGIQPPQGNALPLPLLTRRSDASFSFSRSSSSPPVNTNRTCCLQERRDLQKLGEREEEGRELGKGNGEYRCSELHLSSLGLLVYPTFLPVPWFYPFIYLLLYYTFPYTSYVLPYMLPTPQKRIWTSLMYSLKNSFQKFLQYSSSSVQNFPNFNAFSTNKMCNFYPEKINLKSEFHYSRHKPTGYRTERKIQCHFQSSGM